jgi:hypothetical protein
MRKFNLKEKALTFGLMALLLASVVPSSSSASIAATAPVAVIAVQNPELDFIIVNQTGYSIKELYIGASGTGDWTKEDEVLKGKAFTTNTQRAITFKPRTTAKKWDVMVKWSDGSGGEEWLELDLTEIDKLTLIYDAEKDKTSAIIN